MVAGARGSAPSSRCKAHPSGTGLTVFAGFCRVFGVLLVGEMGLFQGGVVRASFMKSAICFFILTFRDGVCKAGRKTSAWSQLRAPALPMPGGVG